MNQAKVQAVKDWPQLSLQWFLGFANFYRRFIALFSKISAPLTSMLRNRPKSLSWDHKGLPTSQRSLLRCSYPVTSKSSPTFRRGSRHLHYWGRSGPLSATGGANQTSSMCLFLQETPRRSRTMTLIIGNFWQSSQLWRSGDTGRRELNTLLKLADHQNPAYWHVHLTFLIVKTKVSCWNSHSASVEHNRNFRLLWFNWSFQ